MKKIDIYSTAPLCWYNKTMLLTLVVFTLLNKKHNVILEFIKGVTTPELSGNVSNIYIGYDFKDTNKVRSKIWTKHLSSYDVVATSFGEKDLTNLSKELDKLFNISYFPYKLFNPFDRDRIDLNNLNKDLAPIMEFVYELDLTGDINIDSMFNKLLVLELMEEQLYGYKDKRVNIWRKKAKQENMKLSDYLILKYALSITPRNILKLGYVKFPMFMKYSSYMDSNKIMKRLTRMLLKQNKIPYYVKEYVGHANERQPRFELTTISRARMSKRNNENLPLIVSTETKRGKNIFLTTNLTGE